MPAYARYDMYDDDDKLITQEHIESEDEKYGYGGLGGAGKGYTRVLIDDDAESATSMDENTQYLFDKAGVGGTSILVEDEEIKQNKKTKREVQMASEAIKMWSQKMMIRLYAHMDISTAEQIMIEQLSEHGVEPKDLTPVLMANARVKNPMADEKSPGSGGSGGGAKSPRPSSLASPRLDGGKAEPEEEAG